MNSYVDTDQYAIQQNNVGVHSYMIGDIKGALHCFRQALSAKLASEYRILATTITTTAETTGGEEKRLQNLDSLALEVPVIAEEESQQRCVTPELTDFRNSVQLEVYASGVTGTSYPSLSFDEAQCSIHS
jgi:hypothetical protein